MGNAGRKQVKVDTVNEVVVNAILTVNNTLNTSVDNTNYIGISDSSHIRIGSQTIKASISSQLVSKMANDQKLQSDLISEIKSKLKQNAELSINASDEDLSQSIRNSISTSVTQETNNLMKTVAINKNMIQISRSSDISIGEQDISLVIVQGIANSMSNSIVADLTSKGQMDISTDSTSTNNPMSGLLDALPKMLLAGAILLLVVGVIGMKIMSKMGGMSSMASPMGSMASPMMGMPPMGPRGPPMGMPRPPAGALSNVASLANTASSISSMLPVRR